MADYLTNPKEYKSWCGMKDRCYNSNNTKFYRYGGRGITICDKWRVSFQAFFDDLGPKPDLSYSLERVNLDGNYEPSNCIWASPKTQSNNRRTNHSITFNGKTQNLTAWARELGINHQTLAERFKKGKWSIEKCLTPLKRKEG